MTKFWTVGIVSMADQITEVQRVKQATMNGYFYVLTAIDLFVLSFMCILTKLSESLNKKQKQGFFLAFALIAAISVLEVVTLAVDGIPAGYRWLNILSNYLGFGLSPGVCLCLVYVMDRKKRMNRWFRAAVCCEACYLLFLALSIPAGLVFSVSADNVYSRGQYFYIYIILYFAAIVYLSVSTFVTAREFQNRSRALIYPLMIFLLIETIIQVTLPDLHVTWLCVTLLSVLYFIYCSEMWNQLDALTGLLNQNSYLNRTAEMRRRGYCYRTGGDEFCVLMENADREAQCAQEFVLQLEQRRKAVDFLPTVSFGSAPFLGEDVLAVKNRADREMYRYKKAQKPDAAGEITEGERG